MTRLRRLGRLVALPAALGLLSATTAFATPAAASSPPPLQTQPVLAGTVLHPKPVRYVLPVSGYRLTGRFGDVSGLWSTVHTGLDFATGTGTPVRAVSAGRVVESAYDGAYGNRVVLRLDDGTVLWFCHLDRAVASVGQRVETGQVIGYVGSTGNVTGPHLHLEVHPGGGGPVDPAPWLTARGLRP